MNRIITISREFGSGGRELGRRLAEELKIAYYDQEIVTELIERTGFALEYVRQGRGKDTHAAASHHHGPHLRYRPEQRR